MDGELGPRQTAGRVFPAAGWPAKQDLDYLKVGIELLFLLLAIPWVIRELVRHPGRVARKAGQHHLD